MCAEILDPLKLGSGPFPAEEAQARPASALAVGPPLSSRGVWPGWIGRRVSAGSAVRPVGGVLTPRRPLLLRLRTSAVLRLLLALPSVLRLLSHMATCARPVPGGWSVEREERAGVVAEAASCVCSACSALTVWKPAPPRAPELALRGLPDHPPYQCYRCCLGAPL